MSQVVSLGKQSYSKAHNQMTASNNIAITKMTTLKKKSNVKTEDMDPCLVFVSLSDEDKIALNSPEKGKDF